MTIVNESDYVKIERALKFFLWFIGYTSLTIFLIKFVNRSLIYFSTI
jgi:inner membrane protein involved in colicin E2 resistance